MAGVGGGGVSAGGAGEVLRNSVLVHLTKIG